MSVRLTLPLKRALTGPILTLTAACSSVSESFSRLSHPGMEALSVSASLSRAHTVARSAGSTNSPDIVTAMAPFSQTIASALRCTRSGEARLQGPFLHAAARLAYGLRGQTSSLPVIIASEGFRKEQTLGLACQPPVRAAPLPRALQIPSAALALGLHLHGAP